MLSSTFFLRLSLSIVYVWFGVLKILNLSPVAALIYKTYPSYPEPMFIHVLGYSEVVIGVLLLFRISYKIGCILLLMQMIGIFLGLFLAPSLYFNGSPFLLSVYGEFVMKNIVFVTLAVFLLTRRDAEKNTKFI